MSTFGGVCAQFFEGSVNTTGIVSIAAVVINKEVNAEFNIADTGGAVLEHNRKTEDVSLVGSKCTRVGGIDAHSNIDGSFETISVELVDSGAGSVISGDTNIFIVVGCNFVNKRVHRERAGLLGLTGDAGNIAKSVDILELIYNIHV